MIGLALVGLHARDELGQVERGVVRGVAAQESIIVRSSDGDA